MNKKFCLIVLLSSTIVLFTLYVMVTSWSLEIKKELIKSNSNSNSNYEQNDNISLNLILQLLHYKAFVTNSTSHPSICIQMHNKFNSEPKNGLKSSYRDTYHSKTITAITTSNLDMIRDRRKLITIVALDIGYVNSCLLKTVGVVDSKDITTYQNIYLHQIKNKLGRT
jgi:hypothetical protein